MAAGSDSRKTRGTEALPTKAKQFSNLAFTVRCLTAFSAVFAATVAFPERAAARPLVPAERRYSPFNNNVPVCDDPVVFERIQGRFHDRESQFWDTGLEIVGFEKVREIGYKTNGLDYIPRRYCSARAYLNNDKWHPVFYSIDEDQGIIGFSFGVTWCVHGLDRNDVFAPKCKMARP
jgi:hypothetical protein